MQCTDPDPDSGLSHLGQHTRRRTLILEAPCFSFAARSARSSRLSCAVLTCVWP